MTKPTDEQIKRAEQVHKDVCKLGAGIINRRETVTAILQAHESELAKENKRLRGIMGGMETELRNLIRLTDNNLFPTDNIRAKQALRACKNEGVAMKAMTGKKQQILAGIRNTSLDTLDIASFTGDQINQITHVVTNAIRILIEAAND